MIVRTAKPALVSTQTANNEHASITADPMIGPKSAIEHSAEVLRNVSRHENQGRLSELLQLSDM